MYVPRQFVGSDAVIGWNGWFGVCLACLELQPRRRLTHSKRVHRSYVQQFGPDRRIDIGATARRRSSQREAHAVA